MPPLVLVRYGELALKSPPVRREFERTLSRNILDQFLLERVACRLRSDHGHVYVEAEDGDRAVRVLRRIFGITSVSVVTEAPSDAASVGAALLPLARPHLKEGATFAVRARRTGQHSYTSQELARDLGALVLSTWPELRLRVDLERPDVELFVEVRASRAYLYFDRRSGPGGLPLGVAGRVVALVDGTRGALGAWLMMKRGCRCGFVATDAGGPFVHDVLRRFDPKAPESPLAPGEAPDASLRTLAEHERAEAVVLPLGVVDYPGAREFWADRVVFSPTVGLTDAEVDQRWRAVVELAS